MEKKTTLAQRLSDKTVKHYSPMRTLCVILTCIAFLAATGYFITIPAYQTETQEYYSAATAALRVGVNWVLALICGIIVLLVKGKSHKKIARAFAALGVLLMVWLKIGGYETLGVTRWIRFGGIYFQPIHVLLIVQILILAYLIEEKQMSDSNTKWVVSMWAVTVCLAVYAYWAATDWNHMLAILGIGFLLSMLFNGYLFEHIAVLALSVLSFVFMVIKTLFWDTGTFSYRHIRIDAWIHPDKYPLDYAYETVTSLNAIRSGGWFGLGYGKTDLADTLPDTYSSNIFPLICNEMGWLFAGLLVLVYVVLSIEIFKVFHSELNRKRNYSAAIVLGVFVYITYEYALCILSSLNLLPDVARYLPFISYHGPWIIVLMVMIAFVLRVTLRQIKEDKTA